MLVKVLIAMIVIEALIEGAHDNYYLASWRDWFAQQLPKGLSMLLQCPFCQSFWAGWIAAVILCGWSLDAIWAGIVIARGANIVHRLITILDELRGKLFRG